MKVDQPNYSVKNIKAIVGLGNPGARFDRTRHNIGFSIVDELAQRYGASWQSHAHLEHASLSIEVNDSYHSLLLVKPQTFMNKSGQVVPFLAKKGIKADQILVVHDELEKKFGSMSVRFGGSARGHNGLRSMISFIGKDFWRLRFGIGRPERKEDVGNYVLTSFTPQERDELETHIDVAIKHLLQ